MKLGIIGLTATGKTTLFNSLLKADENLKARGSKKLNIKMVPVPDPRLDELEIMFKPKKKTFAYVEFVDLAGLEPNGRGAGNQFLQNIREVDALVHVVRAYTGSSAMPAKDIETVNLELIVSDLESVEKRIENIERQSRNNDPKLRLEKEILDKIREGLENDQPARILDLMPEEITVIKSMGLLTLKPVICCLNISEKDIDKAETDSPLVNEVKGHAEKDKSEMVVVCARMEEELAQLDEEDRKAFMEDLGIKSSALDKLVKSSYKVLNLISFLTAGSDEVRAWTINRGDTAPVAASVIHSDIQRGFIRAETISFDNFIEAGSFARAKEKGLLRSEGKQYVVKDGDIIDFRFNV